MRKAIAILGFFGILGLGGMAGAAPLQLHPVYDSMSAKWGFADNAGKIVVVPRYDDFYGRDLLVNPDVKPQQLFEEAVQAVKSGRQWGFLSFDQAGEATRFAPVKTRRYVDSLANLSDGLARISIYGRYGYVNRAGEIVILPKYEEAQDFSENLAAVKLDGRWLVINAQGKIVRPWTLGVSNPSIWLGPLQVTTAQKLSDGSKDFDARFLVYPENAENETLRSAQALGYSDGSDLLPIKIRGKWGYLNPRVSLENPDQSLEIAPQFDEARLFSEGLAAVKKDGKWGYIDGGGNFAIAPQYRRAGIFSNAVAAVKVEDKYGYVDKTGALVIAPQFDRAGTFNGGLAAVLKEDTLSYIDASGKIVFGGYDLPADELENRPEAALRIIDLAGAAANGVMGAPSAPDDAR